MLRKSLRPTCRREGRLSRRRVFRPILEIFETRRLLSVNVLTYHNDGVQSGLNPNETVLTPSNVNSAEFGKIFSVPLDGQTYAQPLYMSGSPSPARDAQRRVRRHRARQRLRLRRRHRQPDLARQLH